MSDLEEDLDMSPHPLSRVRPNATVLLTPDAIALRPKLAPFIAEIIARWAAIEANLRIILAHVLRAEAAPVVAMLHAINSAAVQINMMQSAATAKLFDPELEIFEALLKLARAAAAKRNDIAHHVWGHTDELPEALLLIEPTTYSDGFIRYQRLHGETEDGSQVPVQGSNEGISVYREKDLVRIRDELKKVETFTIMFIHYMDPTSSHRDRIYRWLCSEPLIDAALISIRKNRQPRPRPVPPVPRTESDPA